MVLMALDHTRDYFCNITFNPLDPARTDAALYFTRWITHFCAPVFVFLAGTGAFLYGWRRTRKDTADFLLTRGLWLIVLEFTLLKFAWSFNFSYRYSIAAVIWAIGCSMIALAPLVCLPVRMVALVGIVIIGLHNLLDGVNPSAFGRFAPLWSFAHVPGFVQLAPGHLVLAGYPVLPWIGIMCAGYAFGSLFQRDPAERNRILSRLGMAMIAGFVALRAMNFYGDSLKWCWQKDSLHTLFSFLNTQKYPPSLLYALMTLGPAILLLAFIDQLPEGLKKTFVIFGRVPLAYYVLHIFLIHGIATALAIIRYGSAPFMFAGIPNTWPGTELPKDYGYSLGMTYLIWIGIVALLFPICKWFAGIKQRRRDWWLSYL